MNSELSIFSSSGIDYGILQKWHFSTQVVELCLNKNSFHTQFYIMRTSQNLLAHVNYVADVEKIDSDGKTHASLNICMHVCVYVFSIRVPTSVSMFLLHCLLAVSLFLNKEILLWEYSVHAWFDKIWWPTWSIFCLQNTLQDTSPEGGHEDSHLTGDGTGSPERLNKLLQFKQQVKW